MGPTGDHGVRIARLRAGRASCTSRTFGRQGGGRVVAPMVWGGWVSVCVGWVGECVCGGVRAACVSDCVNWWGVRWCDEVST